MYLFFYTRLSIIVLLLFIFFFKQKTAYDLRISDWSSDVCSSDLDQQPLYRWRKAQPCGNDLIDTGGYKARATRHDQMGDTADEIGRASCRERVCQYGVDLGGRRIIKKKNKEDNDCT